jgi:surface antigen
MQLTAGSSCSPEPARRAPGMRRRAAQHLAARTLATAAVSAVLAVGTWMPAAAQPQSPAGLPSLTLCQGWRGCDASGFTSHGYAAHFSTMYWRMYSGSECTNYTAFVESTVFRVTTPGYLLGNGGQWAASAARHGVLVNHTPSVGAVAEWDGGSYGIGSAGHVAVVEQVGPGGSYIVISQQNMGSDINRYEWTMIRKGFPANEWQEWPSNFIHFKIRTHVRA